MASALLYLVWEHPTGTALVLLALAVLAVASRKLDRASLGRLADRRPTGGGICAFARGFDLHDVDPRVVRAVYEEVASYCHASGVEVSFRADDDLIKDIGVDPDDLDMEMATNIAARTGGNFEGYKTNPYYGATNTARGLVMFFNSQPRGA